MLLESTTIGMCCLGWLFLLPLFVLQSEKPPRGGKQQRCACRFDGVTAYQTDWSIAAVTLRAQGSPLQPDGDQPFNLPMASLEGQPGTSPLQRMPCLLAVLVIIAVVDHRPGVDTGLHALQLFLLVESHIHCGRESSLGFVCTQRGAW